MDAPALYAGASCYFTFYLRMLAEAASVIVKSTGQIGIGINHFLDAFPGLLSCFLDPFMYIHD